ncbi:MAG: UDP-N-acetylmuramoyl-L-alanine--D-glutamate ligase [Candidatus Kapaibacterium sp.]
MRYTVLGAAASGVAAAVLAKRTGHEVFVSEYKAEAAYPQAVETFRDLRIDCEFGGHTERVFDCDRIITSPGIKPSSPVLTEARRRGIPVISELEFGYEHSTHTIIAITGTNGKTTTTALTAYVLNKGGRKAVACGNIGTPLSAIVLDTPDDTVLVVECSSYQLDATVTFRPHIAVFLNLTPDHLEYHGSVENYRAAKWKICANQGPSDILISCVDDAEAASVPSTVKSSVLSFSVNRPVQPGMFVREGDLVFATSHKEEILMSTRDVRLPGVHNVYNSMAAALAARCLEIRNEDLRDSLASFSGVEHRLEYVRTIRSTEFINDSKATNVNATWYAVQSFSKPVILIAGGRGDRNDYGLLDEAVRKHVTCIVCMGEEQQAIFDHFCTLVRCIKADSMADAVSLAFEQALGDDIVLFSPACKSFDMFMNYEHRGDVFKEAVNALV